MEKNHSPGADRGDSGSISEREATALGVEIHWETEPNAVFVDHGALYARADSFALLLCALAPERRDGKPRARIVSSVRMTPQSYMNVLTAMASTWNRWTEGTRGIIAPAVE